MSGPPSLASISGWSHSTCRLKKKKKKHHKLSEAEKKFGEKGKGDLIGTLGSSLTGLELGIIRF